MANKLLFPAWLFPPHYINVDDNTESKYQRPFPKKDSVHTKCEIIPTAVPVSEATEQKYKRTFSVKDLILQKRKRIRDAKSSSKSTAFPSTESMSPKFRTFYDEITMKPTRKRVFEEVCGENENDEIVFMGSRPLPDVIFSRPCAKGFAADTPIIIDEPEPLTHPYCNSIIEREAKRLRIDSEDREPLSSDGLLQSSPWVWIKDKISLIPSPVTPDTHEPRPRKKEVKTLVERKRYFFVEPSTSDVKVKQAFENALEKLWSKIGWRTSSDRDYELCWIHPDPPKTTVICSYISVQDCNQETYQLKIHAGVIPLFMKGKMTKEMIHGFIYNSWHLSHLCGNWTCCNPAHHTVESNSINQKRKRCHNKTVEDCPHDPPCLAHMRQAMPKRSRYARKKRSITPSSTQESDKNSNEEQSSLDKEQSGALTSISTSISLKEHGQNIGDNFQASISKLYY